MPVSQNKILALLMLFLLALSACGGSEEEEPPISDADMIQTQAAEIAAESSSKTATAIALKPTSTNIPAEPSPTVTLVFPTSDSENGGTLTPLPTSAGPATPFSTPTAGVVSGTPCLRANFEYETIPDGTRIPKNKEFVKLWRLKNTGSCTWTSAYSLKFVDGDLLGAPAAIQLTELDVPPGGFVEIEVDMTAPSQAGPYKGYWMLLSPDGKLFGVGISGIDWFWIQIEVFIPQ